MTEHVTDGASATGMHHEQVAPDLDHYDGGYLHVTALIGADGNYREARVKVERVTKARVKVAGGNASDEQIVYFSGKNRGLVLTRVNVRLGYEELGSHWIGKELTLHAVSGVWFGKPRTIIRIKRIRVRN